MALSCPEPYPVKRIPIEWTCLGFISTWRGKALQVVGCSFMAVLQPNPKPFHNVFFVPVLVWGSKPRGLKHVHVVHCPCWDMRAVPCWKTSTLEHVHFVTVHTVLYNISKLEHFHVETCPCWNISMFVHALFLKGEGGVGTCPRWNMSKTWHENSLLEHVHGGK